MIQFEPLFQYIKANLHRKISMAEAADVALFSPVHLSRLFQLAYGMTPAEYIRRRRLTESVAALQDKSRTVLEIALDFGFEHEQSFTRAFCAEFGVTPGRYCAARMAPETAFDFWDNTRPMLPAARRQASIMA